MSAINDYEPPTAAPDFYEVLQATKDNGLVGEEDTVLTVVLAMIRGGLIIMSGPARGGKDEVVDAAEQVFDVDDLVYRWPVDDSETAAYYNRHEINQYDIHRFPDLARLEEHHEKILKAFGEGRDAERNRTDISQEQGTGDAVEDQILQCPKTTIAFLASDNQNVNLDNYPELRNRALILSVDASEDQTSRVNRRKAMEHAGLIEKNVDPMRTAEIQQYHSSIPVDEWTNKPGTEILNPAAVSIQDQQPIPEKYPEARQDFDRLLGFMETVTLHHYADRVVADVDGIRRMYTTPVDIWEAMTILGNKMVMSALNLDREGRAILSLLDSASANLTKADIQQQLRAEGFNIGDADVRRSLDSMREKGYVREYQDNPNTYTVSDFAQVVHHDAGLDYKEIVDASRDTIYNIAPEPKADAYVENFCEGDGLITTHPFTGRAVDITETDDLVEMMETGIEDVEEVLDESTKTTPDEQERLV
jgi:Fe2+ or Zn2+ uptake regulation protein